MRTIIRYVVILIIFIITGIILNFYNSNKHTYDEVMIFGIWKDSDIENEIKINLPHIVQIDVFSTINNKLYKKVAPGSKGEFIIKFNRPQNTNYKINIIEKTAKPQNLVFFFENKVYSSIKDMQDIINEKFINTEELKISWEWKNFNKENHDVQDTEDAKNIKKYFFEIEVIVEERMEI